MIYTDHLHMYMESCTEIIHSAMMTMVIMRNGYCVV